MPKRRRTGEFEKLTDAEVASLKAVVGEAFEGFGDGRPGEGDMGGRELEFPAPEERYIFDREVVVF